MMTMERLNIESVLGRLKRVKRVGSYWTAECPSHADRKPSLSIRIGDDGKLLIFCHAGCSFGSVMSAIGFHGHGDSVRPETVFTPPAEDGFVDFAEMLRLFMLDTIAARLEGLSAGLGVTVASLKLNSFYWADRYQSWAIPMRGGDRKLIGIRLRAESGDKWTVRGSHSGLFIPTDLPLSGPLYICEGPTDCSAMLDLGAAAIGRPSCNSGTDHCIEYLRSQPKGREVVIFSNRDEGKELEDGTMLYPGQDGARELANKIYRPCKIVMPPKHKDARAWLNAGATASGLKYLVENTRYHRRVGES